jgi:hypothetical protein
VVSRLTVSGISESVLQSPRVSSDTGRLWNPSHPVPSVRRNLASSGLCTLCSLADSGLRGHAFLLSHYGLLLWWMVGEGIGKHLDIYALLQPTCVVFWSASGAVIKGGHSRTEARVKGTIPRLLLDVKAQDQGRSISDEGVEVSISSNLPSELIKLTSSPLLYHQSCFLVKEVYAT